MFFSSKAGTGRWKLPVAMKGLLIVLLLMVLFFPKNLPTLPTDTIETVRHGSSRIGDNTTAATKRTCASFDAVGNWTQTPVVTDWDGSNKTVAPMLCRVDQFLVPTNNNAPLHDDDDDDKSNHNQEAVCDFTRIGNSGHFPHAMQQLLRCWSFWRLHPNQTSVLVYPRPHNGWPKRSKQRRHYLPFFSSSSQQKQKQRTDFLGGFIQLLVEDFGVELRAKNVSDVAPHAMRATLDGFALQSPQHMEPLKAALARRRGRQFFAPSSCRRGNNKLPSTVAPRIAILNRQDSRYLANAQELAAEIQTRLRQRHGSSFSSRVPVVFFENYTFLEQVQFFAETDIVVSPHGAQLTGAAFLPSRCGALLEIFPAGYCLPYYFGSLVAAVGAHHSYIPVLTAANEATTASIAPPACHVTTLRGQARSISSICPPTDALVDAVLHMVTQWETCCRRVKKEIPPGR